MKLGKIVGLALMALTLGLAGQSLAAEPIKICLLYTSDAADD